MHLKSYGTWMENGTSPCVGMNLLEMVFQFGRCIGMITKMNYNLIN